MFLYFRRFFCLIRFGSLLKIMTLRLCLFYVFRVKTIRFPKRKRRFLTRKTYGSASGNVEYGSRFVSLCRWILLFLCGGVNR